MSHFDKSHRTSKTEKQKSVETMAVLKLLNSYAESYKLVDNENKSLKEYISDLKINLKVSKQIIDTFISKNSESKYQSIILKFQKENKMYSETNELLTKKNLNLQKEIYKYKEIINNLKEEIEDLRTKKFILEETLLKKESIIMTYKKGLSKNNYIVIHPNKGIIKMNDELLTYKAIYEKISKSLKLNDEKIDKYEAIIASLQTEKEQLKTQNKIQLLSVNREKENLKYKLKTTLNTLNEDKSYRSTNTPKIGNLRMKNLHINSNNNNALKNKLQMESLTNQSIDGINFSKLSFNNDSEEFKEVLKQAGLSFETYILLSSNKLYSKLTDTIELMFKLVTDKNMTIKILEIENENLNEKNIQLNEENMLILKKNNDSMLNNSSKITINNLNINSLKAYQKVLNKNDSSSNSSKEDTDSVIHMKKTQNLNKKNFIDRNLSKSYNLRRNEHVLTLESSITSSEFGRDCKNYDSFASSIGEIEEKE